jgi:predicted transposase YbfD/YdcC
VICNLLVKIWNIKTQASRLSTIPNAHFSAPYSRLWLLYLKATETEHHARERAHRRMGPVVRIAPNELSVNCIENGVKTIYSGGFEKGEWYKGFVNYG